MAGIFFKLKSKDLPAKLSILVHSLYTVSGYDLFIFTLLMFIHCKNDFFIFTSQIQV
jgi:hypothetical protein